MAVKTNCEKNGTKYYRLTATIGRNPDGTAIRKEFYGKSKADAETKYEAYKTDLDSGVRMDYKNMTVGNLMRIWIYDVIIPSKRADGTKTKYEGIYRIHVNNSKIHSIKIGDITGLDIQRFYSTKIESGTSANTIKDVNKVLKMFFGYAIDQRFILSNPCKGVELPKDEKDEKKEWDDEEAEVIDPFSDEEIGKIKTALKGNDIEFAVYFALATGLREGEQLALTERDIDIQSGVIKINKCLKKTRVIKKDGTHKYMITLGPPKTKSSRREVPIPDSMITPLKRHILLQKKLYFQNGVKYYEDSPLFTTKSCSYIDQRNLLRAWERVLKKADVKYRCWHYLRHTYATKLFEADVDIKTVSGLLGHSSITETEKIYVHLLPKKKTKEVNKLNYLFS